MQEQLHFPDNIANVVIEEGITAEFVTYSEHDGTVVNVSVAYYNGRSFKKKTLDCYEIAVQLFWMSWIN